MKYFLHDSSSFDDEKITELYLSFGYEGLGLFYTILEKISKQEKPIKTLVLKAQLNVGKKLEKCWAFMEKIDMISSSNGETFNERILSYSESYVIKKEKTRERVLRFRESQAVEKNVTRYKGVSNAPKVNRSKVNRILYRENISLTEEENGKLIKEYGPILVENIYDYFKDYKVEKNYKTKSDYLTIKRWVADAVKNKKNGTTSKPSSGNSKSAGANEVAERFAEKLAARGTENING